MLLRKLKIQDAEKMLSWMHCQAVVKDLYVDFKSKTIDDAIGFIQNSLKDKENLHLAVCNDSDEYMGTVSLKHIKNKSAEFAIVVHSDAMGKGYAWFAMKEIISKAFHELDLESIYWCVSKQNARAIRFYDKHFFHESLDVPDEILQRYQNPNDFKWYSFLKGDVFFQKKTIADCNVINIKTIPTIKAGELSFFESCSDIPFEIKRLYYITKVPEGVRRGFHAHKKLKQLIFCPYGTIQLVLDNGVCREEIELSDPSIGVLITKPTWREMIWLKKDSVLCVAASDYYDKDDYIRSYDDFLRFLNKDCFRKN